MKPCAKCSAPGTPAPHARAHQPSQGHGAAQLEPPHPEALTLLQQARDEGLDVSCDVYPYCAGSTQLLHLLPQDFLAGGTDAVAARLRDPAQRDILRERIAHGRDFDNIAQMVGWDNIRLTTLHRAEFQPLTGKRWRRPQSFSA